MGSTSRLSETYYPVATQGDDQNHGYVRRYPGGL
jgi:hypothetical protein